MPSGATPHPERGSGPADPPAAARLPPERQEPRLPQDLAAAQRCPAGPPPTRSGAAAQRTHRRPPGCPRSARNPGCPRTWRRRSGAQRGHPPPGAGQRPSGPTGGRPAAPGAPGTPAAPGPGGGAAVPSGATPHPERGSGPADPPAAALLPPERQEPRLPLDLAVVQCPCCPWNAQTPGWWHCCARPCTLHSKSNLSTSPCFLHYSPTCQPPLPSPWDGGGYVFPMLRVPALTPGFGNESNTQLG